MSSFFAESDTVVLTGAAASGRTLRQRLTKGLEVLRKIGWWLEKRRSLQLRSRRLRVTDTVSLGDKRFVAIVEVDGAQFLIGGGTSAISLLAEFKSEPASDHFRDLLRAEFVAAGRKI